MAPSRKGLRTFGQTLVGLVVGLALVVWRVPGVPTAVHNYVIGNELAVFTTLGTLVGVPAGIVAWLHNKFL